MLYAPQIRAARALLGWSQAELAEKADTGSATIQRLERGQGLVSGHVATVYRVQAAFEAADVRFLSTDENGGIGVRLSRHR